MRLFFSFACILCCAAATAQVPDYVPTNGLIAWWPLDGNANDASGNENHATMNNAVPTIDRFGSPNSAFNFNGIDQRIEGIIGGSLNTSFTTVTVWMRYTGNAGGQPYDLFMQLGQYGSHTFAYGYNYNDQNLDFYSHCTGGVPSHPPVNLNNNWHFVAIVDSDITTTIYVDGQVLHSGNGGPSGNCYQGSPLFLIGGGADGQWVTGDLDDIGFWNRALIPSEIEALYAAEAPPPCVSGSSATLSGLNTSYQTTDSPSTLVGTPEGGLFFGPGVTGAEFDPAAAGPGSHTVVYTYIDQNGCVNSTGLCTVVAEGMGLNDPDGLAGSVRVHPNPTDGTFTLELELQGLVTLTVHDGRGRQVLNQTFMTQGARTTRLIDLSREAAGAYMIRIATEEGSANQQLIKR